MNDNQRLSAISNGLSGSLDPTFALHAAGLGIWEIDSRTNEMVWDQQCQALVGLTMAGPLALDVAFQHSHPDDLARLLAAIRLVTSAGSDCLFDETFRALELATGNWRWVRFWGHCSVSVAGELPRFGGVAQDISAQVLAQQLIQENERKLRAVIENAPLAIGLLIGPDHVLENPNQAFIDSLGKGPDINGKPLEVAMPELITWQQPFLQILREVYSTGIPYYTYNTPIYIERNGVMQLGYYNFSYTPLRDEQGKVYAIVDIADEVTEHVLAQQQTEESRRQLLTLFDESPVGVAIISRDNLTFQMANPFYAVLTGRDVSQLVGKSLLEALPELQGQGFDNLLNEVFATGTPYVAQEVAVQVMRNQQLETIYIDFTYQPQRKVSDKTEYVNSILVVCIDVTGQVLARKKVESSEATLRTAVELAKLGTWHFDVITGQMTYSERLQSWLGIQTAIHGRVASARVHPKDRQRVSQAIANALETGGEGKYDEVYTIINALTGQEHVIHASGQTVFDSLGNPLALSGTAQDVTLQQQVQLALEQQVQQRTQELTRANQALQRSQDWLAGIFEQAPVAIALLEGPEYRIKLANASLYAMWQLPPDHEPVLDKPVFDAFPGIAGLGLEALLDQVRQTGVPIPGQEQPAIFNRQGRPQTVYINFVYAPIYDGEGNINVVVVATEVTEQVLARQNVEQSGDRYRQLSEELAAANQEFAALNEELETANGLLVRSNENLQKFAYVASHDLQEPLRKIRQFGDLLQTRYANSSGEATLYIERMQSAASRMSTLIKDLLDYSRLTTQQNMFQSVSLTEIVRETLITLELVIAELGATVTVGPLPTIEGDSSQLEQLFQNLLSNALKFRRTDEAGQPIAPIIRITMQLIQRADLPPSVKPVRVANAYYRVDVADNGVGFDEKYLDRIFQVFQRLYGKKEYMGTGIGLAICEKVVANHGGAITAASQIGQGATFQVYFPRELSSPDVQVPG